MGRAILVSSLLVAAATPSRAETIVIRPDPCPALAEQPLIIDLGDVELFNAAPATTLGNVFIIYPPVGDGWASARLLMRFDLDRPLDHAPAHECGPAPVFRLPR